MKIDAGKVTRTEMRPVEVTEDTFTLTLTKDEMIGLAAVCAFVGGNEETNKIRNVTDNIWGEVYSKYFQGDHFWAKRYLKVITTGLEVVPLKIEEATK